MDWTLQTTKMGLRLTVLRIESCQSLSASSLPALHSSSLWFSLVLRHVYLRPLRLSWPVHYPASSDKFCAYMPRYIDVVHGRGNDPVDHHLAGGGGSDSRCSTCTAQESEEGVVQELAMSDFKPIKSVWIMKKIVE